MVVVLSTECLVSVPMTQSAAVRLRDYVCTFYLRFLSMPNVGFCVACAKEAEIGVILDHSSSIEFQDPNNWDVSIKGFLTQLIDAFPIGPTMTRMGMVGFSSDAWLYFGFDTHNDSRTLTQAVIDWELHGGNTNIAQVYMLSRKDKGVCHFPGTEKFVQVQKLF